MTDRVKALTVTLEKDIRDDDIETLVNAIKMLKGILDVENLIVTHEDHFAYLRAKRELGTKLWDVLYPEDK